MMSEVPRQSQVGQPMLIPRTSLLKNKWFFQEEKS